MRGYPDTDPLPVARTGPRRGPGGLVHAVRGLAGALAAGLVVLALGLGAVQWVATATGVPGPGAGAVVAHALGAVLAVLLQAVADRSAGVRAGLAGTGVLVVVLAVLAIFWWV